jgi:hypothetical protein
MRARKRRARAKQRAVVQYYDARGAEVRHAVEAGGDLPDDDLAVALLAGAGLVEEAPAETEVTSDAAQQ